MEQFLALFIRLAVMALLAAAAVMFSFLFAATL